MSDYKIDERHMLRCIALALKYYGKTEPNPVVGAIVVKDGKIVGRGAHKKAGTEHAEVLALKQAGKKSSGATLYVTLEPCNHHGRTGPCSQAIVEAGVIKVVYGLDDPNMIARGGAEYLRQNGIEVLGGVLSTLIAEILHPWITKMKGKKVIGDLLALVNLDGSLNTDPLVLKKNVFNNLPNLLSIDGEDIFRSGKFDRLILYRLNSSGNGKTWPLNEFDFKLKSAFNLGNHTVSIYVHRNN